MALLINAFLALGLLIGIVQGCAHADLHRAKGRIPSRVKVQWAAGRVVVVLLAAVLAAALQPVDLFALCCMACSALTFFPMVFHYVIADQLRDKGWHPLYLGATSYYDRLLLWWQLNRDVGKDPAAHYRLYNSNLFYRADVHDAGLAAYLLAGLLTTLLVVFAATA